MKRASRLFTEADRAAVRDAVAEAESKTSGEIVPVVATVSGRYDRGEDLFGLVFSLALLAVAWVFFQDIRPVEGDWETGQTLALGLLWVLLLVLGGFLLGAALATWIPALRLPFTSRREMREEVERAAAEAFHRFSVRATGGGTGVLIYVSLHEHQVHVLADDAIAEKVEPGAWRGICEDIIVGMRDGRPAEGLIEAIRTSGELLAEHFPVQPDDVDEIHNELHLLD